jgi:hypothetical protein
MGLRRQPLRTSILLLAAIVASAPVAAAKLYKWVDERGVTNYSNTPPARTGDGRPATLVEDQLSIYTPDEPLREELKRAKARLSQPSQPVRAVSVAAPIAPIRIIPDPCANPGDPNCSAVVYDSFPAFPGHVPLLAQTRLPPGATAGNVTTSGNYIPGLSAAAPNGFELSRAANKSRVLRAREPRTATVIPPEGRPDGTRARSPRQAHAPSRR